jgi:DNA polymerase-3 subunit epsilon
MFDGLGRRINRRRLKDPAYAGLFEPDETGEVVSLDCETTGLDTKKDEILSIGAVKVRGNRILASERLELLVRPKVEMKAENIAFHWLRPIDVAAGLPIEEALARMLAFVGSRPLVGYYIEFDVAMINRHLRPWLGIALPQSQIDVSRLYYEQKFRTSTDGFVDLSFEAMRKDLGIPTRPRHTAFSDALLAAMMYVKLTEAPLTKRR